MLKTYKATKIASYIGYITQAIVNNLSPLLFVTFSTQFGLDLSKISLLITINFGVQILTDLISAKYIMKLGYRPACVWAHILAAMGLCMYGILPFIMPPFWGLMISTIFCAVGGGLDEVIISPVIEGIPGDRKEAEMSLLHSFYCWGQVLVVVGSTLFFKLKGIENWRVLPFIWAVIPLIDAIMFFFVPIHEMCENEEAVDMRRVIQRKEFLIFFIIMICAGASELAMSQWASLFAEEGLGVTKAVGDLLGPCLFAVFMGISRTIFGIFGPRLNLERCMIASAGLCVVSYIIAALVPNPIIALSGCGLCGFSVGLMWPGTYSISTKHIPEGGARMFALLALAGDIGCTSGPDVAGLIGNAVSNIRTGLLCAVIFPIVLGIATLRLAFYPIQCQNTKESDERKEE